MKTKIIIISLILMLGVTLDVIGQTEVSVYKMNFDSSEYNEWSIYGPHGDFIRNESNGVRIQFGEDGVEVTLDLIDVEYLSNLKINYEIGTTYYVEDIAINFQINFNDNGWVNLGNDTIVGTSASIGHLNNLIEFEDTEIIHGNIKIKLVFNTGVLGFSSAVRKFDITGDLNLGTAIINSQNPLEDGIKVYSNNKSVYISSDDYLDTEVMIYNMNGQLVRNEFLNINNYPTEIDLSENQAGMYMVVTTDGENVFSERFILK